MPNLNFEYLVQYGDKDKSLDITLKNSCLVKTLNILFKSKWQSLNIFVIYVVVIPTMNSQAMLIQ